MLNKRDTALVLSAEMLSSNFFANRVGDIAGEGEEVTFTSCDLQLGWVPLFRLPFYSALSWYLACCSCLFPSVSLLFGYEWLVVIIHSEQCEQSFSARLLKDWMCVLKKDQANPQLVQGSRRDFTQIRAWTACLWDPASPSSSWWASPECWEPWGSFWNYQYTSWILRPDFLKAFSPSLFTWTAPVWRNFLCKYSKQLKWRKVQYNVTNTWLQVLCLGPISSKGGKNSSFCGLVGKWLPCSPLELLCLVCCMQ